MLLFFIRYFDLFLPKSVTVYVLTRRDATYLRSSGRFDLGGGSKRKRKRALAANHLEIMKVALVRLFVFSFEPQR